MKSSKLLMIAIVLLIALGGVIFLLESRKQLAVTRPNPTTEVAKNEVSIENFAFNPATLTVKVGDKVTWVNNDSTPHTIKGDNFVSGTLNTGDKFEFVFNNPGTFNYICSIHPVMQGRIIVE